MKLIIDFKMAAGNGSHEMEQNSCRRQTLSQHGPFLVESCGCGMVHLTFGFLTMRLAPSAVDSLCATLLEAVQRFERPQAEAHH